MICAPLKQLVDWCGSHDVTMSRSDLIRITCGECQQSETCPAGVHAETEEPKFDVERN